MSSISEQILQLKDSLPSGVSLLAVSKFHPVSAIKEAYQSGQRLFAESHALELVEKHEALPKDIEWHFIGHLQTNKVKYVVPIVSLIHSADSIRVLKEINKQSQKVGKVTACLLQVKVAQEDTKYGFSFSDCYQMLKSGDWHEWENIRFKGLMCMSSNVSDKEQIEREFEQARLFFQEIKNDFFKDEEDFKVCSWGMSGDYPLALLHGSNMVRIGSYIFGERHN